MNLSGCGKTRAGGCGGVLDVTARARRPAARPMPRISARRVSEVAITALFLALVRTLAEYYRLRYARGGEPDAG
jgi:hypothetical protein